MALPEPPETEPSKDRSPMGRKQKTIGCGNTSPTTRQHYPDNLNYLDYLKSLGVTLDASHSMETQISKVAHQAFYHLCQVKQLAPYLFQDDLATVIHATVTSRLDYCNSLYVGLPSALTWKLRFRMQQPEF